MRSEPQKANYLSIGDKHLMIVTGWHERHDSRDKEKETVAERKPIN